MKYIKKILVFILFVSCSNMNENKNMEFNQVLEDYFQESLYLYKIDGTFQGDSRYNDTLPNFLSDEFVNKKGKAPTITILTESYFDDSLELQINNPYDNPKVIWYHKKIIEKD